MPTRHYFAKAIAPPPRRKAPDYRRKIVMTTKQTGSGTIYRAMAAREAASQQGRSKGGQTAAARGMSHRWTSESAKEARQKGLEARYGRLATRIGVKVGGRIKYRPSVNRAALRVLYTERLVSGVGYDPFYNGHPFHKPHGQWLVVDTHGTRCISERTALRRLGHLPTPAQGRKRDEASYVPDIVTPISSMSSKGGH